MFDVGFSELLLLAIVALVVLGPEKLPHAARIAGAWVGRIRRTVSTLQAEIEREVTAQEVKARLEKQLGGTGIIEALQQERQDIEAALQETQQSVQEALAEPAATPSSFVATPDAIPLAGDPAPPMLPEVARPLEDVTVDGEQAYREWLESQRSNRIAPPAPATAPNDTPAS